ncbi:hypothetical protein [Chengkuizengella axinellae]|uniref:Uncharacterized protein n=1 Tax=Chengkuizengella axinellae TaxID=3064388 RepID=A0ABT9IYN6_9BACL|nr:hypothetical protein [Chengkuizengella sp. 2205SS18-9]MDP5274463.1 hypothetical protein [Chengkuizengella sp. 2205SS18-9]
MGVFDESKCDCCVCPMQCVLEQMVNIGEVGIASTTFNDSFTINQVKDFIAFTDQGEIPISQITAAATLDPTIPVSLKPIKKSKGECACCEDPITNVAKLLIGQFIDIEFIFPGDAAVIEIIDVGEGIIVGTPPQSSIETDFISSCAITRINPLSQQEINNISKLSIFQQPKISPPTT